MVMRPPLITRKRDSLVLINQQSSQPTLLSRRPPLWGVLRVHGSWAHVELSLCDLQAS